jgi:4-hydroxy-tetrahydrodipicolinate reductase
MSAILLLVSHLAAPPSCARGVGGGAAASRVRMSGVSVPPKPNEVTVVMNGLPGAMGIEVAQACLRRGMRLAPVGLTGPSRSGETIDIRGPDGAHAVRLVAGPASTEPGGECEDVGRELTRLRAACGGRLVCIDYTHPSAVNANAAWYARHGLDFVMGTTGGDRAALEATVASTAHLYAVIAPNMAKQIVALQAGLARMARDFPGAFDGYTLAVTESHQASKADTSGTAKAISRSLAVLASVPHADDNPAAAAASTAAGGAAWSDGSITRIRDEPAQLSGAPASEGGYGRLNPVPSAALSGHAYHTYSLVSSDGSVEFQWRHNVNGRRVYAEGTADAAVFLAGKAAEGASKRLYTMVDILESGAMR